MLSKAKPPFIISQRRPKRRLVPQDPSGQRPSRVGLVPALTHARMALYVTLLSCHILMLCEVRHSSGSKRHDLLTTIPLKNRVPFFLRSVRAAHRLQTQASRHFYIYRTFPVMSDWSPSFCLKNRFGFVGPYTRISERRMASLYIQSAGRNIPSFVASAKIDIIPAQHFGCMSMACVPQKRLTLL